MTAMPLLLAMALAAGSSLLVDTLRQDATLDLGPPVLASQEELVERRSSGIRDDEQLIQLCVDSALRFGGAPGIGLGVIQGGELIHLQGHGNKRVGLDDPVGPDTVFRVASVSKQMIGALALELHDAARLDLDDPLMHWLPDFEPLGLRSGLGLTLRRLLEHSGAVPDLYEPSVASGGSSAPGELRAWANGPQPLAQQAPAARFFNYSSRGYSLAGALIEAESASGLDELLTDLWQRHDMQRTGLRLQAFDEDVAEGHVFDPSSGRIVTFNQRIYDGAVLSPAVGVVSTARDLSSWASDLLSGEGFLASIHASLLDPQRSMATPQGHRYGFGLIAEPYRDTWLVHHAGSMPGSGAWVVLVPEHDFAVAVLGNLSAGGFADLPLCLIDQLLPVSGTTPAASAAPLSALVPWFGEAVGSFADGRPVRASLEIINSRARLRMTVDDRTFWSDLRPRGGFTFDFDSDGDGILDSQLTLIESTSDSASNTGARYWLRSRHLVLEVSPTLSAP